MRWSRVATAGDGPGKRSSHAAAACGGALYVYGGEREPRQPVDGALFRLAASGAWARVPAAAAGGGAAGAGPGPRVAAGMAAVGSRIYLFGGRTGIEMGEGARDDLWVLDTAPLAAGGTPEWRIAPVASGTPPPARSYHAVASAGGKVYVFGGCGAAGRLADLWCYDPAAAAWEELPPAPAGVLPRGGAALVASAAGDKLLLLGGFSGKELGDCHTYDIAARRWSCGDPSPAAGHAPHGQEACGGCAVSLPPRSVFGAAVHVCAPSGGGGGGGGGCEHGGHVLVFGGEVDPSTQGHAGAGGFSDEVFCIDLGKRSYHALQFPGTDPRPCARGWFASAAVGDKLYVTGGLDVNNDRLDDVWVLEHSS